MEDLDVRIDTEKEQILLKELSLIVPFADGKRNYDATDANGNTLLILASALSANDSINIPITDKTITYNDIVAFLLSSLNIDPVNIDHENNFAENALFWAVVTGNLENIKQISQTYSRRQIQYIDKNYHVNAVVYASAFLENIYRCIRFLNDNTIEDDQKIDEPRYLVDLKIQLDGLYKTYIEIINVVKDICDQETLSIAATLYSNQKNEITRNFGGIRAALLSFISKFHFVHNQTLEDLKNKSEHASNINKELPEKNRVLEGKLEQIVAYQMEMSKNIGALEKKRNTAKENLEKVRVDIMPSIPQVEPFIKNGVLTDAKTIIKNADNNESLLEYGQQLREAETDYELANDAFEKMKDELDQNESNRKQIEEVEIPENNKLIVKNNELIVKNNEEMKEIVDSFSSMQETEQQIINRVKLTKTDIRSILGNDLIDSLKKQHDIRELENIDKINTLLEGYERERQFLQLLLQVTINSPTSTEDVTQYKLVADENPDLETFITNLKGNDQRTIRLIHEHPYNITFAGQPLLHSYQILFASSERRSVQIGGNNNTPLFGDSELHKFPGEDTPVSMGVHVDDEDAKSKIQQEFLRRKGAEDAAKPNPLQRETVDDPLPNAGIIQTLKEPETGLNRMYRTRNIGWNQLVNLQFDDGETPLTFFIKQSNLENIKLLLSLPYIDVNQPNRFGETPLIIALQLLISVQTQGDSPIHDIIKQLLSNLFIDVNKKNSKGESPISISKNLSQKDSNIIELLNQKDRTVPGLAEKAYAKTASTLVAAGQLGQTAVEKAGQLGQTAVGKAGQLGQTAVGKAGQLGQTAVEKAGQLGQTAVEKAGQFGQVAVGKAGQFGQTAVKKAGQFGQTAVGKAGQLGQVAVGKAGQFGQVAVGKACQLGRTLKSQFINIANKTRKNNIERVRMLGEPKPRNNIFAQSLESTTPLSETMTTETNHVNIKTCGRIEYHPNAPSGQSIKTMLLYNDHIYKADYGNITAFKNPYDNENQLGELFNALCQIQEQQGLEIEFTNNNPIQNLAQVPIS